MGMQVWFTYIQISLNFVYLWKHTLPREACVLQFKITMDKKHEKSMFRTELVLIGSMILA